MKLLLKILLFLFPAVSLAQNAVKITPAMFDKTLDQFYIAAAEGWLFKQGSDTTWAKKDININAYNSVIAKDNSIKVEIKTGFDDTICNINIIPQDIGRVLLNLYNNAFYAVTETAKQEISGYKPTVSVSTKKEKDRTLISTKDNGNGIVQKIADKIFQPFFTTKPTGQGTGLGLSLSYDIVKAHGGEIQVETKEGDGAAFIFKIPR